MKWISVKEKMPDINTEVLIICPEDGIISATLKKDGTWIKYLPSILYGLDPKPTHWMPLPQLPSPLTFYDEVSSISCETFSTIKKLQIDGMITCSTQSQAANEME